MVKKYFHILVNPFPTQGKKSLPIWDDTHLQISVASAKTRKTMADLIAEAWPTYLGTPPALVAELHRIADESLAREETPERRKEQLAEAWRTYISHEGLSADKSGAVKYKTDTGATLTLTPLQTLCVERLLRILGSPKPGLPDAIESNLVQFEDADILYRERAGGAHQAAGSEASQPRGAGERDAEVAALERDTKSAGKRIEEAARELADLDEAGKREHRGKAGDLSKTRKRSGS